MSDIAQRFEKDMLTLSAPIEPYLEAQGVDVRRDTEFMSLVEPDTVLDAYRLQMAAGAQVLVTATRGITPARLAHHGLEDRLEDLAVAALTVAKAAKPQHILVEIWPCGLPLDPDSAYSLKEHRDQYARVAKVFETIDERDPETGATAFDGFLLGGFADVNALKAAIAGIRMVSDRPVFASVTTDGEGYLDPRKRFTLEEAVAAMAEFGADVAGFATFAGPEAAADLARRVKAATDLPLLVSIAVPRAAKGRRKALEGPYATPESMLEAASALRAAGAQFLRATSQAGPAYTAVLAAATTGFDVVQPSAAE